MRHVYVVPSVFACLCCVFFADLNIANAQSNLDDVHVTARMNGMVPATDARSVSDLDPRASLIKKNVELVLVPVTITDDRDRVVTGLAKENFQVFEGKQQQEIRHFSSEDTPISIGILFDSSGSMKDKMDRAREAVHNFCQRANPQDEFFMVTFSDSPELIVDLTRNTEEIENKLMFVNPHGRTALIDAVYLAIKKMRQATYQRRAILIISDGGDNHSRYTESEIMNMVKEADVTIFGIGVFDRHFVTEEEQMGPELLEDLAATSGGRAFAVDTPNVLSEVAIKIGTELRNQYVLGYTPVKVQHDGKWHKINVKLALPRKFSFLRIHSKTGYYAPKD